MHGSFGRRFEPLPCTVDFEWVDDRVVITDASPGDGIMKKVTLGFADATEMTARITYFGALEDVLMDMATLYLNTFIYIINPNPPK
jgi:hypothetical protein